ncbi:hypothetical protein ACJA88_013121 [Fusarium oxysporum]
MAPKLLTDLPSEIRQQIFKECLKVDGGYVYNAQTDKLTNADEARTPIDLSLRYTCCSIARDTKTIPLAVNTIHFSTSDNWRSLAGCFNLVATAYYILEQDLVFHLAEFITPAMFAQIDAKFPRFRSMFESELANHNISNPDEAHMIDGKSNLGTSEMHSRIAWGSSLNRHQQNLTNHVYKALPHWVGKYQSQEFLRLKFNLWHIPSTEEVAYALALLNIHDFVWKLPEVWKYPLGFYQALGDDPDKPRPENAERGQYAAEYDNPMRLVDHFDYRYREKIRFSATTTAIRFLNRLPAEHRTQIRRLTLHEDSPSVNMPSLHAQGLAPLFKENSLLRVERRVSVFGCVHSFAVPGKDWMTRHKPSPFYGPDFLPKLQSWLIDALAMRDLGIPLDSFIFTLEGGPYSDLCNEVFQAFKEAIEHLVNKTSIFRSDFNPGVPVDPNALVEESIGFDDLEDLIERWEYQAGSFTCKMPTDLYYDVMLASKYDLQTREQYIESQGGKVTEQDS